MTNAEMQVALAGMLDQVAGDIKAKYPNLIRLQNDSAGEDIPRSKCFTLTAYCDYGTYTVGKPLALPTKLIEEQNVRGIVFNILYAIW